MTAIKPGASVIGMILISLFCVIVVSSALRSGAKRPESGFANTRNCDLARMHLDEADHCLAGALDGLRKIHTAKERIVIGDPVMATRFENQIVTLREQLRRVRELADRALMHATLPEINPLDDD